MKITFYGHSCFGIETMGKSILIDPFITPNPKAEKINIENIRADVILLTHGHQDHVADVEKVAQNHPPLIVSNFEIVTHYANKGISGHGMNHGGRYLSALGEIKMVNAIHSSSFSDGSYAGNPAGFVLRNEEGCIYIAGDTSVFSDMKLIPQLGYKLDLAILPIGDNYTMGFREASLAAKWVGCDQVLGCHFDTFPPIEIDHAEAQRYFNENEQTLLLLNIGDKYSI